MKKLIGFAAVCLGLLFASGLRAQILTPQDDGIIVEPEKFHHNSRVVSYPFLRQADLMWSTRHWERIDVREKMNHHLYYPLKPAVDRKSLFDVLVDGIVNEGTINEVFQDDRFTVPLTPEKLQQLVRSYDTVYPDPDDRSVYIVDTITIRANNVIAYNIKSDWYFDKQRGEMKNRIIGLAPVVRDPKNPANVYPLFWVWYPDTRFALATNTAFNRGNNVQRLTYDEIFHLRFFSAVVYKEENVYDRTIEDYRRNNTLDQLLEAQAIQQKLRDFEHDLWEF